MVPLLKKYPKVALPFILIFILSSQTTLAASGSTEISWMMLIFGLVGGLALFLFGMELMSEGMKKTAGNQMRAILATLTSNRVVALLLEPLSLWSSNPAALPRSCWSVLSRLDS